MPALLPRTSRHSNARKLGSYRRGRCTLQKLGHRGPSNSSPFNTRNFERSNRPEAFNVSISRRTECFNTVQRSTLKARHDLFSEEIKRGDNILVRQIADV